MSTTEHHTSRYFIGMKVEIEIPMPNSKMFRDWAIINEIDEDLVSLQLSRDILPEGVNLHIGQVLKIASQTDGNTYTCRAFIVSKGYEQDLLLRFTSETFSNELREFYRVDAFIPIKFHILYDQNPINVREQWEAQRKLRRDEEAARKRSRLEAKRVKLRSEERVRALKTQWEDFVGEPIKLSQDKLQEEPQDDPYYESWGTVTTHAVNISGGGLRIFTNQKFNMDELILLETYVPSSQIIVDIIARVVFTDYNNSVKDDKANFSTAMQFVFIDESASSAINTYISSIQLRRIRQFKGFTDVDPATNNGSSPDKHYAYIDSIDVGEKSDDQNQAYTLKIKHVILVLFSVCITCLFCLYLFKYSVKHPKSEIQEMFENSIRKK